ncbi:MAG: DUF1549 domain-containing protein [Isosphaeraceae bacterium]
MGTRDLVFLSLLAGGAAALGASLLPQRLPERPREVAVTGPRETDLAETVSEVDRAFREQWRAEGIVPTAPVSELNVVRRLSLGLTGTIPSLEEIRTLERLPREDWIRQWTERLLRDRRYADHVAERFARAFVGTENGPFIVFRRRRFVTWLSDQIHENRRYDQITRDLIASDGIWTDRPATNFMTVTYDPEAKRFDPERLAGRVSRAFLGARIDCAQCHDHPFAAWKQADFQGLAAFFGKAESGFTGVHEGEGEYKPKDRATGEPRDVAPRVPFAEDCLPDRGEPRQRLASWLTDPKNPALARATVNRAWGLAFGRPLVEPVDDLPDEESLPPALTILARDFVEHGYDLRRLFRLIASTEVFQLDSAGDPAPGVKEERAWAAFPLSPLRPEQVVGALSQTASVKTIDGESPILMRIFKSFEEADFVKRYGDLGEEEFEPHAGTIPQRLLLMNGKLVREKTKPELLSASKQIAMFAPTDRDAIEAAYLTVLSRVPTAEEYAHFEASLRGSRGDERGRRLADLMWTLINVTEFSWNH